MLDQKSYTIMAIDDTINNLNLLKDMLTKSGYKVIPFTNGTSALKAADKNQPDLILLDITMPDLNGYEVCRLIKDNEKLKNIPVIFLSALNEIEDKVKAFNAGGVDYISKPFQFEEVEARVSTHLKIVELQNELKVKNGSLEKSLENLEIAQDQLIISRKLEWHREMLARVAHEINTPLGVCVTSSSFLMKLLDNASEIYIENKFNPEILKNFLMQSKESCEIMKTNINRLNCIIDNFKHISADFFLEEIQKFEIGEHIQTIMSSLSDNLSKNEHKVEFDIVEKINITNYKYVFLEIFHQLVINSIIHGFEDIKGGIIKIEIRAIDNKVRILYRDNGKGIPANNLKIIFEPFYTTKKNMGMGRIGLGLYSVFNIITQTLKGNIECRSELGKFTEFEMTFMK